MSTTDDLRQLIEVAKTLNPRAVAAEVKWLRAGPRGPRLGQIGRTAEKPLPLPDHLDRQVARDHKRYRRNIATAARAIEDCRRIQAELLVRLHLEDGTPTTEALALAEGDKGKSCAHCGAVIKKLYAERCRNCHEYQKRHDGADRPRELIDREIADAAPTAADFVSTGSHAGQWQGATDEGDQ